MSEFWNRQLHRICFVLAPEDSFWAIDFDALEGKRGDCLLGEPTRRRRPTRFALLRRQAVRRLDPSRPLYVLVLDSTGYLKNEALFYLFGRRQKNPLLLFHPMPSMNSRGC